MKYLIFLILFSSCLMAQDNRGNVWVIGDFGFSTGQLMALDFNADSVAISTIESAHAMPQPSITTLADRNGDLLLYSNGCDILNKHHQVIPNGDALVSDYDLYELCEGYYTGNTLGVLFATQPCDPTIVHLIYLDQLSENLGFISRKLMRTTIDLSDKDHPAVIERNALIHESIYDKGSIFMTKHSNGLDWWICLLRLQSSCYDCFHLSESGFSEPVTSCSGPIWGEPGEVSLGDGVGAGGFSPDGRTYVRFNFKYGLNVYDFDNITGELNHKEQIFLPEDDFLGYVGTAISPDSRFLYASAKYRLYQFDLYADSIADSGIIVDTLDYNLSGNHVFRIAQLAPDGKIYIAGLNTPEGLHVVHEPNQKGKDCKVEQLGLRFPDGARQSSGLPNNPWYGDLPTVSLCDSLLSSTSSSVHNNELLVYPNPSTGTFGIEYPLEKIYTIEVYDINGIPVYRTEKPKSKEIMIEAAPGIYHLVIRNSSNILITTRIVIL